MLGNGVKPELEIFEVGMAYTCLKYFEKGLIKPPLHFQFVLGTPGHAGHSQGPSVPHRNHSPGSTWSVIGIGPGQLPLAVMEWPWRPRPVGLEDNIYYSKAGWPRAMPNWWNGW